MQVTIVGFLKLRRQCGVSHEVRQGAQGASLMAPGNVILGDMGKGGRSPCELYSLMYPKYLE